jgi:hypothetical protein
MPVKGPSPGFREAHPDPTPPVRNETFDRDVAGSFQGGDLFRQRRVGQSQPITDEGEVDPVGAGE